MVMIGVLVRDKMVMYSKRIPNCLISGFVLVLVSAYKIRRKGAFSRSIQHDFFRSRYLLPELHILWGEKKNHPCLQGDFFF